MINLILSYDQIADSHENCQKKNANTVINLSLNESNGSEKLNSNCKEINEK